MSHTIIMKNKITGIYKIENTINGKFYIGCSGDIARRWKEHVKGYGNKYLYNAIKKYGEDSFIFIVLEECKMEEMFIKEKQWMERLRPVYNLIQSVAGVYKHSLESRLKMGLQGENNPRWKGGVSLDKKTYDKKYLKEYRKTPDYKKNRKLYDKKYYLRKRAEMERLNNE